MNGTITALTAEQICEVAKMTKAEFMEMMEWAKEQTTRPQGEWRDNGDKYFRCSLCGIKDTDKWHWCHGCGARMKGAE